MQTDNKCPTDIPSGVTKDTFAFKMEGIQNFQSIRRIGCKSVNGYIQEKEKCGRAENGLFLFGF